MPQAQTKVQSALLTTDLCAAIDAEIAKYPPEGKQSALLAALRLAQETHGGWLSTELMDAIAGYLDLPPIAVYEVASFYTLYDLKPVGRHKIYVCTNISCMLCGSGEILDYFKKKLGVGVGETTPDGKFTLKEVECLAACAGAPMCQIGKQYHENLTPQKIDQILAKLD
ncbi:MAG TPA: NAD(P)H-dependent oxidoreductase subunit E [Gammaproteobacteria bacterium]|nr:NAD(P)H-dependent oxidoreductase subunit E [Gammaproteobacteria bacterium]